MGHVVKVSILISLFCILSLSFANIAFGTLYSTDVNGKPKTQFFDNESVYLMAEVGPGNTRAYIVADNNNWQFGAVLNDATGGYEVITGNPPVTLVWSTPLAVGKYDMVEDRDQDGIFDFPYDQVFSNTTFAFEVIATPTTTTTTTASTTTTTITTTTTTQPTTTSSTTTTTESTTTIQPGPTTSSTTTTEIIETTTTTSENQFPKIRNEIIIIILVIVVSIAACVYYILSKNMMWKKLYKKWSK